MTTLGVTGWGGSFSPVGWSIQNLFSTGVSFNTSQVISARIGLTWNPDGSAFYAYHSSAGNAVIYQYTVSTPWYLSTAAYASKSKDISASAPNLEGVAFKPDGSKMYVVDNTVVRQYTLSTPWDITTATYDTVSLDIVGQTAGGRDIRLKPDGSKMYVVGLAEAKVFQYTLATPWDLSTASYDTIFLAVVASAEGLDLSADGTQVYIEAVDRVYQYGLTSAWDLSTGSYRDLSAPVTGDRPQFNADGNKLFSYDRIANIVYEYSLTTPWFVSLGKQFDSFSVAAQNADPRGLFFKPDGTKAYVLGQTNPNQRVYQYTLSTPWDLTTIAYDIVNFLVSGQETAPTGLFFKPDGAKMYVVGSSSDRVHQYTLATPWDISTTSADGISVLVSSQDTVSTDLFFSPDGTKMYLSGDTNDRVYQYTLGTPWVVSTAVYDTVFLGVLNTAQCIFFKSDGTRVYVATDASPSPQRLRQYSLSVAWDLATVGATDAFMELPETIYGLHFQDSGTKVYFLSDTLIYEYLISDSNQI